MRIFADYWKHRRLVQAVKAMPADSLIRAAILSGRAVHSKGYRVVWSPSRLTADESPITLATTQKALWLPAKTLIPTGLWEPNKVFQLTAFGKATTDATAGNYVFEMAYGAGDAPTPNATGATVAGSTGQTNISWIAQGWMEVRSIGTAAVARMWGFWKPAVALLASTLQPYIFPSSAPADISVDTTVSTNAITFQLQRSSTGVWTATTTGLILEEVGP